MSRPREGFVQVTLQAPKVVVDRVFDCWRSDRSAELSRSDAVSFVTHLVHTMLHEAAEGDTVILYKAVPAEVVDFWGGITLEVGQPLDLMALTCAEEVVQITVNISQAMHPFLECCTKDMGELAVMRIGGLLLQLMTLGALATRKASGEVIPRTFTIV